MPWGSIIVIKKQNVRVLMAFGRGRGAIPYTDLLQSDSLMTVLRFETSERAVDSIRLLGWTIQV